MSRLAACRVLLALERRRTTLGAELARASAAIPDVRDRALLVEIAAGTLRWRNALDAVITAVSGRAPNELDPPVLAVVRCGVYQLRHLTRVPAHAIVHDSVDAVRALGAPHRAGFVNAVLRAVVRRGGRVRLPPRPGPASPREAQLAYLSITCSHPAWLAARWLDRYGFDAAERWCQFNNAAPEITVRTADGQASAAFLDDLRAAGLDARPGAFAESAVRLAAGTLGRLPADLRRRAVVQDEGSQLVAAFAAVRAGERVLDVCAAPGGKTALMAAAMDTERAGGSRGLVAADLRPARVALLRDMLRAAGLAIPVIRLDALQPLPFRAELDCVLLDAPCSGLGTVRRDPDLKWVRDAASLPRLAAAQVVMADRAAAAVRPGGRLVYATCSSEPEEDDEVVDAFLAAHPEFVLENHRAAGRLPPALEPLVDARGCLRTLPYRDGIDAFYAAVLVRRAAA